MKKSKHRWILWLIAAIIAVLLLFIGICAIRLSRAQAEKSGIFPLSDLILSADSVLLEYGETCELNFNVRVSNEYNTGAHGETLSIRDEAGNTVCTVKPDGTQSDNGYTQYTLPCTLCMDADSRRYYAELGDARSEALELLAMEKTDAGKLLECLYLGRELENYLSENQIEETLSDAEILESVYAWLTADARVSSAWISGPAVLYATTDNAPGIYLLPGQEGTFGCRVNPSRSDSAYQAFSTFTETQSVTADGSMRYLDGGDTVTNTRFLVLDPAHNTNDLDIEDAVFDCCSMADEYSEELGYTTKYLEDADAVSAIVSGGLCECGIVNLVCHGAYFKLDDGTFINVYICNRIGNDSDEEAELLRQLEIITNIPGPKGRGSGMYASRDYKKSLYYIGPNGHLVLTSNTMRTSYQNRMFDNSILYCGTCYGMLNQGLQQFFLDRGAKVVIGWENNAGYGIELNTYNHVFHALKKQNKLGTTKAIGSVGDGFLASVLSSSSTVGEPIADWFKNDDELHVPAGGSVSARICYSSPDFRLQDFGTLSGTVQTLRKTAVVAADGTETVTEMNTPAANASLHFHRYQNQAFAQQPGLTTGQNGEYTVTGLQKAIYGLHVRTQNGAEQLYSLKFTDCKDSKGKDQAEVGTIRLTEWGASFEAFVFEETDAEPAVAAGATVELTLVEAELDDDREHEGLMRRIITDSDGWFRLKDLPGGRYAVCVTGEHGVLERKMEFLNGTDYIYDEIVVPLGEADVTFAWDNKVLYMVMLTPDGKLRRSVSGDGYRGLECVEVCGADSSMIEQGVRGILAQAFRLDDGSVYVESNDWLPPAGPNYACDDGEYTVYQCSLREGFSAVLQLRTWQELYSLRAGRAYSKSGVGERRYTEMTPESSQRVLEEWEFSELLWNYGIALSESVFEYGPNGASDKLNVEKPRVLTADPVGTPLLRYETMDERTPTLDDLIARYGIEGD